VKVVVVWPAGTVTEVGKVTAELLEVNLTTTPPGPASPFSVTVPVEFRPPNTDEGETSMLVRVAGMIVTVAASAELPILAVTDADVGIATPTVVTVNVVEFEPAGTVTVDWTVASVLLEARLTVSPPIGAFVFSVTVPVAEAPPRTIVGEIDSDSTPMLPMLNVAVRVELL